MSNDNTNNLETLRHSCAHLLAAAVQKLWPDAKFGIGPAVDNGFYYDTQLANITPDDLKKIEKEMRKIVSANFPIERKEISKAEAEKLFSSQPFKLELIKDLEDETITIYQMGDFTDLCRGPHVNSTKELENFKLLSIAGAYWKGDENNTMLSRLYGTCFKTKEELDEYLKNLEEAKKRDHRKLGKELDLFVFSELVGPGLPLYTVRGALVRRLIAGYSNELRTEIGYQEVWTPQINKAELFKKSGHYDKYKDDMFEVRSHYSKEEYFLKPMNCPQHTQIYASQTRSYKDLPIRIADFANIYRDEKPGELNGLFRLRAFCQDDGHCFCREDQIEEEFLNILKMIEKAMKRYSMDYYFRLSLRDENKKEKYLGDDETWQKSQKVLEDLLVKQKIKYEKAEGEAAFYGPKMDLMIRDSMNRQWQLSTIQLDFNMPKRFELKYSDADNTEKTPVMIHSAIVGSPERFMGILLEHTAGALPFWLSPTQITIIPVAEVHIKYAEKVAKELSELSTFRVEIDSRNESLGKRIREAEMKKTPYTIVLGDKEEKDETITIRSRGNKELSTEKISDFIATLSKEPR